MTYCVFFLRVASLSQRRSRCFISRSVARVLFISTRVNFRSEFGQDERRWNLLRHTFEIRKLPHEQSYHVLPTKRAFWRKGGRGNNKTWWFANNCKLRARNSSASIDHNLPDFSYTSARHVDIARHTLWMKKITGMTNVVPLWDKSYEALESILPIRLKTGKERIEETERETEKVKKRVEYTVELYTDFTTNSINE